MYIALIFLNVFCLNIYIIIDVLVSYIALSIKRCDHFCIFAVSEILHTSQHNPWGHIILEYLSECMLLK